MANSKRNDNRNVECYFCGMELHKDKRKVPLKNKKLDVCNACFSTWQYVEKLHPGFLERDNPKEKFEE